MCGRFNQTASGDEVAEAFGLDEAPELAPRYNIAPTQEVAVVGVQPKTGRRGLARLRWGLVPRESLGGERGFINARAETAGEKPSFREAFAHRRCLIPATGFYEWQRIDAKRRQPWLIRLGSGTHFEDFSFVDDELTIVAHGDSKAVQRSRCRPFEIQTRLKEAATVARTFEFILGSEPTRRATQMGTFGEDGVDAGFFPDDPDPLFLLEFFADFTNSEVGRQSGFEGRRWLKKNSWKCRPKKAQES